MNPENAISEATKKKFQLYSAAVYLFEKGKSHPQIVDILEKYEPNKDELILIVDNAMHEKWDKLYQESRQLFAEGKTYEEVVNYLRTKESDPEIASLICEKWYEWKTMQMEFMVESPENIADGSKWVIISGLVIPALFYMDASWVVKGIWIFTFVIAFLQWIMGIKQRQYAQKIDDLFNRKE
ncbi:MAG: hypothetical protein QM726_06425 [Chitinophagaceae bacterium]